MSSALRRLLAGGCTVVLFVIGFQLFATASADAHANGLSGSSACQVDGTYTVTWTVTNDYDLTETATVVSHLPVDSLLSATSVSVGKSSGNPTATITQTKIPGSATSAYLKVNGKWSDGYQVSNDQPLTLAGTCLPGKQPTTPTYTNGGCQNFVVVKPTLTIPSDAGVSYSVNGSLRPAGRYEVTAGDYTVTAASTSYTLNPSSWGPWHITEVNGDCLTTVTPVSPTVVQSVCKAGSHTPTAPTVTVVDTAAIKYTVVPNGNYQAGKPVTVNAVATAGNKFVGLPDGWVRTDSTHASLTFTLHDAPDCAETTVPVNPTVVQSVCKAGSHTPTAPSVILPTTPGIVYVAGDVAGAVAGNKVVVTATPQDGYKVVVTATLQDGYKWGALGDWTPVTGDSTKVTYTVTFAAAPDCREITTPAQPTLTQEVCPATGTTPVAPTLTVPADSAAISYTATPGPYSAGESITVTATLATGYKWGVLSGGWTQSTTDATQATFTKAFDTAPSCVVPANPTVTQAACAATGTTPVPASVTLATTTGIDYSLSSPPYDENHPATVTATLQAGYQFDSGTLDGWTVQPDGTATFQVKFTAAPTCAETAQPGFSNDECKNFTPTTATYTVPATTGVDYSVNSVLTAPGTYTATDGSTITVTATPQAGYTLVGTSTWSHTFTVTPTCTDSQKAAVATFGEQECVSGDTLTPGTYSVPSSTGVDYLVNGAVVKAGKYTATPGTTVTVVAQAKPGYTLVGASRWSFAFGKAKQCSNVDSITASRPPSHSAQAATTSRAPSQPPLASTGVHSSSLLTIGAGLLVVGVAVTMLASVTRRRRTDGPRH